MSLIDDLKTVIAKQMSQVPEEELIVSLTHYCKSCNKQRDIMDFVNKKQQKATYFYCKSCRNDLPKLKKLWRKENPPTSNCECCNVAFTETNPPCLDHNHELMIFRGWLCRACNPAIGHFQNSVEILQKAIEYLTKHKYHPPTHPQDRRKES